MIIGIESVSSLEDALKKISDFKPKKYCSNKKNMLKLMKKLIDE